MPQYYVEHSHPAIIAPEEWEQVQKEYRLRKSYGRHRNSLSPFSSKIICGDYGSFYGAKVWHSTALSGSATANSMARKSVPPRIYMRRTSRRCSFRLLASSPPTGRI